MRRASARAAAVAFAAAVAVAMTIVPPAARAADDDGAELYQARCANCHDHPQPGLPAKSQLASHPVQSIVEKLPCLTKDAKKKRPGISAGPSRRAACAAW